jgi:protein-disulfide isomerase
MVLLAAAFIVGALIVVSQAGDDSGGPVEGGADAAALFAGIPQSGNLLGDAKAPAVMVEFADLQCPFCAQYAGDVLPDVVRRYVRPGDVRLELDLISRIGPDSERGARAALAAGLQDKMWQFADLFYGNQGTENSGYADDGFIRDVAEQVPGLDASRVLADMNNAAVDRRLGRSERRAQQLGIAATPTFYAARRDGVLRRVEFQSLEIGPFADVLGPLSSSR